MKDQRKAIILNMNSKGGKGVLYWEKISPYLNDLYGPFNVYFSKDKTESMHLIKKLIQQGKRIFISAGGDGCVNFIINLIVTHKGSIPLSDFTIGAVGLGSSNDYHKPFREKIQNIPIRLSTDNSVLRDVGEIRCLGTDNKWKKMYFLVSSSAGIVAEGNENFNRDGKVLDILKKRNTDLAIFWTFFKTLTRFQNVPLQFRFNHDEVFTLPTSYLAVLKTNYISGMMHFEDDILRNDGRFLIKILYDYSKMGLIRCLFKLSRGKEKGLSNLLTKYAKELEVCSAKPFALECDGETLTTQSVKFRIYQERIKECV